MPEIRRLVLGTHNKKKGAEMAKLLAPLGIELQTLAQTPQAIEVEEDAESFAGNAEKKATEQAIQLGMWVLAEDSGLCVDALAGEPGIYSARFSGLEATDQSNNELLLEKLAGVPLARRLAHYVCCMRLSSPSGEIIAGSEGVCCGRIVTAERGTGGFGYDPLFELIEYRRTFGEMGGAVKAMLSHRARASRRLSPQLRQLQISGGWGR